MLTSVYGQAQMGFFPSNINFTQTSETQKDSVLVTLQNFLPFDLDVLEVVPFEKYDDYAFSVSESIFKITANSTKQIWLYFKPNQNIFYEQILVFKTDSRGSFSLAVKGQGTFSNSYYSSTQNKTEETLKTAITARLALNYVSFSYSVARDKMYGSIDNNGGVVECVYTGRTATFNTRPGATTNNFNTEHTWPQSLFNKNLPMRSDIHHLFPTDITANSQRGSLPFGVVTGSPSWQVGGSKKNSSRFEPRNAQKGATARSMMYFVLRYQNYANFFTGQETVLRKWHNLYPPASVEIKRNNDIFAEQKNRSPFVDYPQLLKRINSISSTSVAPNVDSTWVSTDTVYFKNLVSTDSLIYHWVVYNAGNQALVIQNFDQNITTDYEVLNPPTNVTLDPGEAYEVEFLLNQVFSGVHSLTLMTNKGNRDIYVQTAPGLELDEWIAKRIISYPNPTIDHIKIFAPIQENLSYQLIDPLGIILDNGTFRNTMTIDTRSLPWGNYFLVISRYSIFYVEPIVKTRR